MARELSSNMHELRVRGNSYERKRAERRHKPLGTGYGKKRPTREGEIVVE